MQSNFYELGGNSLNSDYTVLKLQEKGFFIGITEFITAKTMEEILLRMSNDKKIMKEDGNESEFVLEMLNDSHKEKAIQ